ncbi:MAG: ABC transporter permease [Acidipila sp.]|nr:ABC transporter permease [Acidipila sp.]
MRVEWLVALRYLRSRNKPAVLRLVSWLSVLGVAAGVATLIVALAMNTGFRSALQERLLAVSAHVHLSRPGSAGIADYLSVADRLRSVPGVAGASPALYQTVLLSTGNQARGLVLKGVDPNVEGQTNQVFAHMSGVPAAFAADKDGIAALLLGRVLAQDLKIAAGDYVTLTSPQGRLTPFGVVPRTRRFLVSGVFESGFYDYDANWGFVTLGSAQALAGAGDVANVIEVRLNQADRAAAAAPELAGKAGNGFVARTWAEENRALFRALRLEKLVTAIFIGLITFVAGLNILVVLAMTVADKARDIAVLMALGARREQIRAIFVLQGLVAGAIGTLAGAVTGYSIALAANHWRLVALDPEVYAISYVPFHPSALDAFWIALAVIAICGGATVYPAQMAARIVPAETLRYE